MFGIPDWAIGVGFIILAGSIARALTARFIPGDRLRGRKASPRDLAETLEDVQKRLGAVEDVQTRLGEGGDVQSRLSELEERLDFTERLLAKQRESERIAPPKS